MSGCRARLWRLATRSWRESCSWCAGGHAGVSGCARQCRPCCCCQSGIRRLVDRVLGSTSQYVVAAAGGGAAAVGQSKCAHG
jgi:hypothetical protein